MNAQNLSDNPCSLLVDGIAEARDRFRQSKSRQERAAALKEYLAYREAMDETKLFARECRDLDEGEADHPEEFRRDLYGRRPSSAAGR